MRITKFMQIVVVLVLSVLVFSTISSAKTTTCADIKFGGYQHEYLAVGGYAYCYGGCGGCGELSIVSRVPVYVTGINLNAGVMNYLDQNGSWQSTKVTNGRLISGEVRNAVDWKVGTWSLYMLYNGATNSMQYTWEIKGSSGNPLFIDPSQTYPLKYTNGNYLGLDPEIGYAPSSDIYLSCRRESYGISGLRAPRIDIRIIGISEVVESRLCYDLYLTVNDTFTMSYTKTDPQDVSITVYNLDNMTKEYEVRPSVNAIGKVVEYLNPLPRNRQVKIYYYELSGAGTVPMDTRIYNSTVTGSPIDPWIPPIFADIITIFEFNPNNPILHVIGVVIGFSIELLLLMVAVALALGVGYSYTKKGSNKNGLYLVCGIALVTFVVSFNLFTMILVVVSFGVGMVIGERIK